MNIISGRVGTEEHVRQQQNGCFPSSARPLQRLHRLGLLCSRYCPCQEQQYRRISSACTR